MIRLFNASATSFSSHGLGLLTDATNCTVTQALNGGFELLMTYPVTGQNYASIALRTIITAPVDPVSGDQPFRVYRITRPLNGVVTVYARHIAYDLQGIVDAPFSAISLAAALAGLKTNAATNCPFTFSTDKSVASPFSTIKPTSIWSLLGGTRGSILDTYGGEWEFNGYRCILHNRRGSDRGVRIAYGHNLTSYSQDQNNAAVYTGVFPWWSNEETTVTLPEQILPAPGTYSFTRILSLDLSGDFEAQPTEAQLRARANAYMTANQIGVPAVSWTVGFVQLEKTEDYAGLNLLTQVLLGDTVHIDFPLYSVTATARAVEVKWDAILGRYDSVTLGSVKSSLAQTIADAQKEIEAKPSTTLVQVISETLGKALLGADGGAIRFLDTNSDGRPDELYIADAEDPNSAQKVWRFNYLGWAASSTGYEGPWTLGATLEDGILANAVTAANLTAGTIRSADGTTFVLDLDAGTLSMDVTQLQLNGTAISDVISDSSESAISGVQSAIDDLNAHIIINSDASITLVGASGDAYTLHITNSGIDIDNGSETIWAGNATGTVTGNLNIPEGGTFNQGKWKWVTRSTGNLQLLYVG